MALTQLDRFKLIAKEFAEREDIPQYLELAGEHVVNNSLSTLERDNLIVYLAAHLMDMSLKKSGSTGQVSSLTLGKASINYATNQTSDYGKKYNELVKAYRIAPLTRSVLSWGR